MDRKPCIEEEVSMSEDQKDRIAVDDGDRDMAEMERVAAAAGKAGNLYAIDLSWRMRQGRGRRIVIDLPPVEDVAGLHKAQAVVIATAAAGKIAPRDALDYSTMLEHRRRMIEIADFEPRLEALEEAIAKQGARGRGH
jgi:hypothetical protein